LVIFDQVMTNTDDSQHRSILRSIAHRVMLERGLVPDFPSQALAELDRVHGPATRTAESTRDLRKLLRCSIDNDDPRDLDQLTVAEAMPGEAVKILVAIADVEALTKHCAEAEEAAKKVERQVGKSAAGRLLESRIGEQFDAIVTGASGKGSWVRIFHPPIEDKLVSSAEGLDVGHKLRVQLTRTDLPRAFIDFKRVR
jgi:exoribonuclease R